MGRSDDEEFGALQGLGCALTPAARCVQLAVP